MRDRERMLEDIDKGERVLAGKRVIVTGAGRGLGESYARHAAAHGASVVVNDVDLDEAQRVVDAITAVGGQAVASGHSVASADDASALVALCCERFGGIDGLVNNAGVYHEARPWDERPERLRAIV